MCLVYEVFNKGGWVSIFKRKVKSLKKTKCCSTFVKFKGYWWEGDCEIGKNSARGFFQTVYASLLFIQQLNRSYTEGAATMVRYSVRATHKEKKEEIT